MLPIFSCFSNNLHQNCDSKVEKAKKEYEGNEKIKRDACTVFDQGVSDAGNDGVRNNERILNRILSTVNKVMLLRTEFPDTRIVQKIVGTVPERFEFTVFLFAKFQRFVNPRFGRIVVCFPSPRTKETLEGGRHD